MSQFHRNRRRVNQSIYGTIAVRFLPQEPLRYINPLRNATHTMLQGRGIPSASITRSKPSVTAPGKGTPAAGPSRPLPSTPSSFQVPQAAPQTIQAANIQQIVKDVLTSLPVDRKAKDGRSENITVGVSATPLASANDNRKRLWIKNESLFYDIRIKIGANGQNVTASTGFLIEAGMFHEFARKGPISIGEDPDDDQFYGAVYAIRTGSNDVPVSIIEW